MVVSSPRILTTATSQAKLLCLMSPSKLGAWGLRKAAAGERLVAARHEAKVAGKLRLRRHGEEVGVDEEALERALGVGPVGVAHGWRGRHAEGQEEVVEGHAAVGVGGADPRGQAGAVLAGAGGPRARSNCARG